MLVKIFGRGKKHKEYTLRLAINSVGSTMNLNGKEWINIHHIAMGRMTLSYELRKLSEINENFYYLELLNEQEALVRFQVINYILSHNDEIKKYLEKIELVESEIRKISGNEKLLRVEQTITFGSELKLKRTITFDSKGKKLVDIRKFASSNE